jgi:CarD family transcriptional regulator
MDRGIAMLNNGEKVFVPGYGAGILNYIQDNKSYDEQNRNRYISISFLLDNIDLYIPIDKLLEYNVRNVINKEIMERAIKIIREYPEEIEKKWSKRYRKNNDKIREGNPFKQCEVIRDLYYLRSHGALPPGEKKILIKAENMLASEMMLVFNITMDEALEKIRNLGK